MPSETAAHQDAALAALRHLDAHIRSIAFHQDTSHAHNPAPLPPDFLPIVPPSAARFDLSADLSLVCRICVAPV